MTINQLLQWANSLLGNDQQGQSESGLLLSFATGFSQARIIASSQESVDCDNVEQFKGLVRQRKAGIPIAYLTKSREFWSLPLYVDERVLIPRHETETLVEQVLKCNSKAEPQVLELGTGSGAIALALAKEFPRGKIIATDISQDALAVARFNQVQLGFSNIVWKQSNWFDGMESERFDVICSNPPYVAADDVHLGQGDLRFEPVIALKSEDNGLADLTTIINQAHSYLTPWGVVMLEHGFGQGKAVREFMIKAGYSNVETVCDLAGMERVTRGFMSDHFNRSGV